MPMLTTFVIGLPVWPFHSPERIRSENAAIRSSTSCTSATTSRPSTISERPRGIRSATCSTARSSVTLMCSPANIASRRSATPASLREREEQPQRLVGDAVLRVVEKDARRFGGEPRAAARIGREEVAEVNVAKLLVVSRKLLVRGESA